MTALEIRPTVASFEVARAWVDLMAPAVELAKAIAGTDFVPKALRQNPAAIAAAILYGDEVGLGPMQSLAKIAVIDGRPALAAEAQRALILRAGHSLWLEEFSTTAVTIAGRRRDEDATTRVTWTLDDARRAGLAGRPSWRNYPRAMLLARASAELARAVFADAIGGLGALEEYEDADPTAPPGDVAELPARLAEPKRSTSTKRRRAAKTTTPATSAPIPAAEAAGLPALPGEEGTPGMSDAQRRKVMALYRDVGLGGADHRAQRLHHAGEVLGRPLESANDLTADEASRVIERLQLEIAEPANTGDPDPSGPASVPPPAPAPGGDDPALPLEP